MRTLPILLIFVWCTRALAIELDGQTEFGSISSLNSSISSRVTEIHVTSGQRVARGDLLLRMDDTTLRADLDHARAQIDSLVPTLEKMQTELDKAQELYDRDSLARVELEHAEQNYAIAAAQLAAAEARLVKARHLLSQAQLRTPIDGIVLSVEATPGQYVNTRVSDPVLITVADNRTMRIASLLPLENWQQELIGKPAKIRFQKQLFDGRVTAVGNQVITGANQHPAVVLHLEFEAGGKVPANTRVSITIDD